MKVLIGTDILFHYFKKADYIDGVELLFRWLKKINADKVVDISSIAILTHFVPLSEFKGQKKFTLLTSVAEFTPNSEEVKDKIKFFSRDEQKAARGLLAHLNLLDTFEVDYLVTENPLAHSIARMMRLDSKVYSIEGFIEKCTIEHRELDDAKGVIVKKCKFGDLSIKDPFFNIFINEYQPYYYEWFKKKSNDEVYTSETSDKYIKALLKLKYEFSDEDYTDITPAFLPAKRMKICSFKIDYNGEKLGERFVRIAFEKAIENNVDEIYITLFNTSKIRRRLVDLLNRWGFVKWGYKKNPNRQREEVYFRRLEGVTQNDIQKDYPYHSIPKTSFIIPIHKNYCSQLIPEDTLSSSDFDIIPSKHSIRKVLVLYKCPDNLNKGSVLFFYKLSSGVDKSYVVAVGVTESVYKHFNSKQDFIQRCRKRSVLSDEELSAFWIKSAGQPIVINFVHTSNLESNKITKKKLQNTNIETSEMTSQRPIFISLEQYYELIKETQYEKCISINKA